MGETNEFPDDSYSSSTSLGVLSWSSEGTSCSSSDLADDASTSPMKTITFSPNSLSNDGDRDEGGPLCELSELMTHLPINRGLSRHYVGKSQSFTSLASARSLEDLMKKENPCAKRMKVCSRRTSSFGPNMVAKAVMSEKRSSFLGTTTSSSSLGKRRRCLNNVYVTREMKQLVASQRNSWISSLVDLTQLPLHKHAPALVE